MARQRLRVLLPVTDLQEFGIILYLAVKVYWNRQKNRAQVRLVYQILMFFWKHIERGKCDVVCALAESVRDESLSR